jgi:hypothetical protein
MRHLAGLVLLTALLTPGCSSESEEDLERRREAATARCEAHATERQCTEDRDCAPLRGIRPADWCAMRLDQSEYAGCSRKRDCPPRVLHSRTPDGSRRLTFVAGCAPKGWTEDDQPPCPPDGGAPATP